MALFFEYRSPTKPIETALREALAKEPPTTPESLGTEAAKMANAVTGQPTNAMQAKSSSFVVAAILLGVLAVLALLAERAGLKTAPDQIWTAFQTVLGVIVGFLGGEATGLATAAPK
jgi:hypothetical protein